MKTRYYTSSFPRKDYLILILTVAGLAILPHHSDGQIAEWTFENITSAVPGLPIAAASKILQVQASATLSGGNNNGSPDACSGNESWSTNFWPTGSSRESGSYLQFSVRADPGETVDIDYFSFSSNASSANSALDFDVYYSKNNFATATFLFSGSQSTGSCSSHGGSVGTSLLPGTTIRFRIYPYGQNVAAQAATIRMDNVTVSGALLPIVLTAFEGEQQKNKIELRWTTSNETNNDHFIVERSPDGINFFEAGVVNGAGNSQSKQYYTFQDQQPYPAQNYYRLRQVDFDGTAQLHHIIMVPFKVNAAISVLQLWPSPVKDQLQISLPESVGALSLTIRDMNGRLVQEMPVPPGEVPLRLMVHDLPPGWYIVQCRTPKQLISRRFLKS